MAENNNNKKKKSNKGKVAFMFAFAVTVLSSRAVSLAASATPLSNDDFDNLTENSNEQNTSKNSDYRKINQNVYIASEQAQAVKNFNNSLQLTRNYAVYAEKLNLTSSEVEFLNALYDYKQNNQVNELEENRSLSKRR